MGGFRPMNPMTMNARMRTVCFSLLPLMAAAQGSPLELADRASSAMDVNSPLEMDLTIKRFRKIENYKNRKISLSREPSGSGLSPSAPLSWHLAAGGSKNHFRDEGTLVLPVVTRSTSRPARLPKRALPHTARRSRCKNGETSSAAVGL